MIQGLLYHGVLHYNPVLIYIKSLIYLSIYIFVIFFFFSLKYFMLLKSTIVLLGNGFHIQSLYNAMRYIHESSLLNLTFPLVLLYFFLLLEKGKKLSTESYLK